jgi:hypothetical protein
MSWPVIYAFVNNSDMYQRAIEEHSVIPSRLRLNFRSYTSSIISSAGRFADSRDEFLPLGLVRIVQVSSNGHRQASHSPGQFARLH